MRARSADVPVILGSATPSLETLENAASGRYIKHLLPQRPGAAQPPRMSLVDLRRHAAEQGISTPVVQAIDQHLKAGGQVIVFLNRRGYAPSLFCNSCGWVAPCAHCDARMTLHRRARQLRCHHCGAQAPVPAICGKLRASAAAGGARHGARRGNLGALVSGRAAGAPGSRYALRARGSIQTRARSSAQRRGAHLGRYTNAHQGPPLSRGQVGGDPGCRSGLVRQRFSRHRAPRADHHAGRRPGRARGARRGSNDSNGVSRASAAEPAASAKATKDSPSSALEERREAGWPPYSRLAMLRAEAKDSAALDSLLARRCRGRTVDRRRPSKVLGPASALIARRADHFRAHLLIETAVTIHFAALSRPLAAAGREAAAADRACVGRSTWIRWKWIERFAVNCATLCH